MPTQYKPLGRPGQAQTAEWRQGIERVQTEAGGMLTVDIFDNLAGAELVARAMAGDRESLVMLKAVTQAIAGVAQAPRAKPALCVACPRPVKRITPQTVFGIASPDTPTRTPAIGFAFCEKCGADRGTLAEKARQGLQRIWPDLRPIVVSHEAPSVMQ
jgi:hypothetical protein